ncbi:glycogen debranching protein [Methylobacillus glycogenes]|uniref:glycogen debranching protein n=1 Tax=Methylobacillus glycogenes TaxID=406 RepID=UPI001F179D42|nr:alpha-amylase family glycosyl hydrolase [Methylobacillus glycogenes]
MSIVKEGKPYPRGAHFDGKGTNFALFSDHASKVILCLFDQQGSTEIERIQLKECTNGVWHGYVEGIKPGQLYGYRVEGTWDPANGLRFNANKLLLDPYARKLSGNIQWDDALYGYTISDDTDADLNMDDRDSAKFMPKAIVVAPDVLVKSSKPDIRWPKTIIYEAHVRGLTMQHPLIANDIRGTFAALSDSAIISHLQRIGVTAIELMPIHAFTQDRYLLEKNLANYWGYNTLAYFAPEPAYLGSGGLEEIAKTVDALHDAGIEIILDVVYNHTCEGNHLGPTLSWKGIDNLSYYKELPGNPRYYDNLTGCGNALNTSHPKVMQMIMDSLRLWASVYGIDGFRFDLALTLGRNENGFNRDHALFHAMLQDPILTRCKLIAEPWDVGPGGFQLAHSPPGFQNGMAITVMSHANSGLGAKACCRNLPAALPPPAICLMNSTADPGPALTSLPHTMASPCMIWSPTTKSTTKPTAKTTRTVPMTIAAGTAAMKAKLMMRKYWRCVRSKNATSSLPYSSRKAFPCCWQVTSSITASKATTTPIVRTTHRAG